MQVNDGNTALAWARALKARDNPSIVAMLEEKGGKEAGTIPEIIQVIKTLMPFVPAASFLEVLGRHHVRPLVN